MRGSNFGVVGVGGLFFVLIIPNLLASTDIIIRNTTESSNATTVTSANTRTTLKISDSPTSRNVTKVNKNAILTSGNKTVKMLGRSTSGNATKISNNATVARTNKTVETLDNPTSGNVTTNKISNKATVTANNTEVPVNPTGTIKNSTEINSQSKSTDVSRTNSARPNEFTNSTQVDKIKIAEPELTKMNRTINSAETTSDQRSVSQIGKENSTEIPSKNKTTTPEVKNEPKTATPPLVTPVGYNSPCNATSDCASNMNLACNQGKCSCAPPEGQQLVFDIRRGKCVIPLGKGCRGDDMCPQFGECFKGVCLCKSGYTMVTLTQCKLEGGRPQLRKVARPVKTEPVIMKLIETSKPNKTGCGNVTQCEKRGLKSCKNGTCTCIDSNSVFVEELGGCLNPIMQATLKEALKVVETTESKMKTFLEKLEQSPSKDLDSQGSHYTPIQDILGLVASDYGQVSLQTPRSRFAPEFPRNNHVVRPELIQSSPNSPSTRHLGNVRDSFVKGQQSGELQPQGQQSAIVQRQAQQFGGLNQYQDPGGQQGILPHQHLQFGGYPGYQQYPAIYPGLGGLGLGYGEGLGQAGYGGFGLGGYATGNGRGSNSQSNYRPEYSNGGLGAQVGFGSGGAVQQHPGYGGAQVGFGPGGAVQHPGYGGTQVGFGSGGVVQHPGQAHDGTGLQHHLNPGQGGYGGNNKPALGPYQNTGSQLAPPFSNTQYDLGPFAGSIGSPPPTNDPKPPPKSLEEAGVITELADWVSNSLRLFQRFLLLTQAFNEGVKIELEKEELEVERNDKKVFGEDGGEGAKEGGILAPFARILGILLKIKRRLDESPDNPLRKLLN